MAKDTALYQLITSFSAITDEVDTRVYPLIRPQGSDLPALTYRKVSSPRLYDFEGIAIVDQSWDIHVYAKSYGKLQEIVQLLENNLSEASGTYGSETIEYVQVSSIGNDDYLDDQEVFTDSVEVKVRFMS